MKKIRKTMILALAMVMLMTSMTAFASDANKTKMVEIMRTAKSGMNSVQGRTGGSETITYLPIYGMTSVSAKAYKSTNRIIVKANTTSTSYKIQIQCSPDKNFKKNVKTVEYENQIAPHTANFIVPEIETNLITNKSTVYIKTLGTKNGKIKSTARTAWKRNLTKKQAIDFINSSKSIVTLRKGFDKEKSLTIRNVQNPKACYVRIRHSYKIEGKTYWSGWKTVKAQ